MISPFTGKEMKRINEKRIWKFRGENFEYIHTAWLCEDTGEQFTTDESDTAGYNQVINQYRTKYGIPFTDEIIDTRKKYQISAAKMSLLLGLGINQYRLYEQGEVPNVSNGKMIRSIMNPRVMLELVKSSSNMLSKKDYDKIYKQIVDYISDCEANPYREYELKRIYGAVGRGAENGYGPQSLERLKQALLYILNHCESVWCTKMNKLLYYIDFLSYRETGMSITGLTYRAIDYGPVPEGWERVYSSFIEISQEIKQINNYIGHLLTTNTDANTEVFCKQELDIIDKVCHTLGNLSSKQLTETSHQEDGWIRCEGEHLRIPFDSAMTLKGI